MSKVLIVGCSYVTLLSKMFNNVVVDGSPGSGNRAIAARVMYQLATNTYDRVVVLWSGINRLDLPIGLELHNTLPKYLQFFCLTGNTVWHHSGGLLGCWTDSTLPKILKSYFYNQYCVADAQYLTDNTLTNVIAVQSLLEAKQIPYTMSFIYDLHSLTNTEQSLGLIDTNTPLYNLVDWSKFEQNTPYEWCQKHGSLQEDQFHPTTESMNEWATLHLKLPKI